MRREESGVNKRGHKSTLSASQPDYQTRFGTGAFSRRTLAPRASEIAEELLEAAHTVPLDRIAAEEIGAVVAMIEAIDEDLLTRGLTDRKGDARSLVELRIRLSGRLERWLKEFGATTAARLQWVERLSRGETLADVVRNEVAQGVRLLEAAQDRGDVRSDKPEDSSSP
jgi:hypothetical protein